ncbi:hypothetical protein FGB62_19g115 [Gracilaria domingensis]|nr:hypothetical protein FGB62_19g115 [Gracilaria domingensis]
MNPLSSAWVKDLQDRVKRASVDVNVALQPRLTQAKRSIEQSIQQFGLRPSKELYEADYALYEVLCVLDDLRDLVSALASQAEAHKRSLLELARVEKQLSHSLAPDSRLADLLQDYVPKEALSAQFSFVQSQQSAASCLQAYAMDVSPPIVDLARTLEESYAAKIVPLRKRYLAQKNEWNRLRRQPDTEGFEAVIETTAAMWRATSETLSAECRGLILYCTSKLADWTLNVAQAKAETYTRAAALYEQPAKLAEDAQNLSS